jgi:hypothetical protein
MTFSDQTIWRGNMRGNRALRAMIDPDFMQGTDGRFIRAADTVKG